MNAPTAAAPRRGLAGLTVGVALALCLPVSGRAAPAAVTILRDVTVIDGPDSAPRRHQDVTLAGGRMGIPNAAVLAMATRNAAAALGKEREIGAVAPGLRADFVVLRRDPLADLGNTRSLELVIQGGRIYRPADLLAAR